LKRREAGERDGQERMATAVSSQEDSMARVVRSRDRVCETLWPLKLKVLMGLHLGEKIESMERSGLSSEPGNQLDHGALLAVKLHLHVRQAEWLLWLVVWRCQCPPLPTTLRTTPKPST
jgi:hypothetical protein